MLQSRISYRYTKKNTYHYSEAKLHINTGLQIYSLPQLYKGRYPYNKFCIKAYNLLPEISYYREVSKKSHKSVF